MTGRRVAGAAAATAGDHECGDRQDAHAEQEQQDEDAT
jgi:hypothetical protein